MFCKNCLNPMDDKSTICSRCGEKIQPESDAAQSTGSQTNNPPKNKNAWGYFVGALQKYATFGGRARRAEYWYYYLFYMLFYAVAVVLDIIILGDSFEDFQIFSLIVLIALLLPTWSVMVRRYHDIDKSAWHCLIPIYGFILLFYDGTPGPNRFGDDPKGRNATNLQP